MRTASSIFRYSVLSSLVTGLILSVGCSQDEPFKDLREKDETTDEDKETGGDGKDTKDSGGSGGDGGNNQTKDQPQANTSGTGGGGGGNTATGDSGAVRTDQTGTGAPNTNTGGTGDNTPTGPNPICQTLPGRLVVLGDFTPMGRDPINGSDDANNGFKMVHEHFKARYAKPSLTYSNFAQGDSMFKAISDSQMGQAQTGEADPVVVMIHTGSNDLAGFITQSPEAAESAFDGKWLESKQSLDAVVAHFEDTSKYPGGATFFINTIYNPFDDCVEKIDFQIIPLIPGQLGLEAEKITLMGRFNQNLRDYAGAKTNFHLVDLHPVFLGHGANKDNSNCTHYKPNAEGWLKGGSTPSSTDKTPLTDLNVAGHGKMGELMKAKIDEVFTGCAQ